ncbi:T6SS immunity protein Tli4 family protein [Pseudoduganella sp. SL102]|uniref:T6SS immunity protein Tli4 family protein n=1 Tax=Pseudoduganella sp. SL102 TaxID=2995154 RepID=UPI00248D0C73|nr:T6SS immunity protein Tli4 family protein [Pseudoduganella sp. SL102]WBS02233.1 T6SS immunity protein Tli4 family protein [Pseudoduganella sp. SL102]
MPRNSKSNMILKKTFDRTKLACFGRYALQVPEDSELLWGEASFPSRIRIIEGDLLKARAQIVEDIAMLKRKYSSYEVIYNGSGPVESSLQIRYYEDEVAKEYNALYFDTYIVKNDLIFVLGDSLGDRETQDLVARRQAAQARSLSLREDDEVPTSQGYCIEKAFMASDLYNDQEMVNAGLYIPTLPDVTFSISSNKDAYSDLKKDDFDRMKREELGLLARIRGAQEIQGSRYPDRTVLREGRRAVQHWQGEESLVRRADGTHDFEWCSIGTPKDVANPAEFSARMYTKVADNLVGAAAKSSLSDAEAIALWDKLLDGLKFRVKVPGAPVGSYYFPPGVGADGGGRR